MKRKGFTLIELLVVIAVIALLLAVLAPALQKAKMSAKKILCRSNLHQWGIAVNAYAQDYGQSLPRQDIGPSGMNAWDVSQALICYDDKGNFGFYRSPYGTNFQPCAMYTYGINKEEFLYCPLLPAIDKDLVRYYAGPDRQYTLWIGYSWWVPRKSGDTLFPFDYPTTGTAPNYKVSWPQKTSDRGISLYPIVTDCIMRLSNMDDLSDKPTVVTAMARASVNGLNGKEVYGVHAQNGLIRDTHLLYADGRVDVTINDGKSIRTRFQPSPPQYKNMY